MNFNSVFTFYSFYISFSPLIFPKQFRKMAMSCNKSNSVFSGLPRDVDCPLGSPRNVPCIQSSNLREMQMFFLSLGRFLIPSKFFGHFSRCFLYMCTFNAC